MRKLTLALLLTLLASCSGGAKGTPARITARVEVSPPVGAAVVIDGDSVWVTASTTFTGASGPNQDHAVARIDARSAEVLATISVPVPMVGITTGDGAVWAVGSDLDPETNALDGIVVRIDPSTNRVAATLDLGHSSPADVAFGFGSVWVADSTGQRVVRIDPSTNRVAAEIAVDGSPSSLAVHGNSVWVNKPRTGQVRAIDPSTNRPLEAVGTGPLPSIVRSGTAGLWVSDYAEDTVARIDTHDFSVGRSVHLDASASRFAVGRDFVVAAESEPHRLVMFDAEHGGAHTVLEGPTIVAVALSGHTLWAVDQAARRLLRLVLPS